MNEEEIQEIEQRLAASLSRDLFGQDDKQMLEVLTVDVPKLIDTVRDAGQ